MRATITVVSLLSVIIAVAGVGIRSVSKRYEDQDHTTVLDSSVCYASCEKAPKDGEVETICTISKGTLLFDDFVYEENCEVKLAKAMSNATNGVSDFKVKLYGGNKAILYWIEIIGGASSATKANLRIQIVNFSTCKPSGRTSIPMNLENNPKSIMEANKVQLVPYNNMFEVIFYNRKICNKQMWCKWSYTKNENKIIKLKSWIGLDALLSGDDVARLYPLDRSGKARYLAVGLDAISVISDDDRQQLASQLHDNARPELTAASIANNVIGVCSIYPAVVKGSPVSSSFLYPVKCEQFDYSRLDMKFQANFTLGYAAGELVVYNLPRAKETGGFLLITKKKESFVDNYVLHVTKIEANGSGNQQRYKSLKISGSECHNKDLEIQTVFENQVGEYCLSLKCSSHEPVDVVLHCFPDELVNLSF